VLGEIGWLGNRRGSRMGCWGSTTLIGLRRRSLRMTKSGWMMTERTPLFYPGAGSRALTHGIRWKSSRTFVSFLLYVLLVPSLALAPICIPYNPHFF